jgi:hypothetical protein
MNSLKNCTWKRLHIVILEWFLHKLIFLFCQICKLHLQNKNTKYIFSCAWIISYAFVTYRTIENFHREFKKIWSQLIKTNQNNYCTWPSTYIVNSGMLMMLSIMFHPKVTHACKNKKKVTNNMISMMMGNWWNEITSAKAND